MNYTLVAMIACTSLFVGMSLLFVVGHRIGRHRLQKEDTSPEVSSAIIGALFALLGLLLAFTFSGAYSRFDMRRQLIVQEANAIGTAYLRLDLLPTAAQGPLRKKFRDYTASRAALYEKLSDFRAVVSELTRASTFQDEIWAQAVAASKGSAYQSARILLLPALNEMIDIVTTRTIAIQTHTPLHIFFIMFAIALTCAGLTGYRASVSEHPGYFYNILLSAITACVLYLILDIEYPSNGLIRLDNVNQVLVELVGKMK